MPSERLLFDSPLIRIGHFACAANETLWSVENVIGGTLVVFPSVPVLIHQAGHDPVVADRNVVMYYNEGQPYRRGVLHHRGDDAVWFALKNGLGASLAGEFRADAIDRPDSPFEHACGPSPSRCYLRQRALTTMLGRAGAPAPIAVEEASIALLRGLLGADAGARGWGGARVAKLETERFRRHIAEHVRELLAVDPGAPWTLDMIVEHVLVSPSHLCRIFKQQVGMTIHQYLSQLRLREAAACVLDGEDDLTSLAIRLGYSTHSHFTDAFGRAFGMPPSRLRERAEVARAALERPAA